MKRFDVIGLGCCCWDVLGVVEHYPALDEKSALLELAQAGGGQTSTGMTAVARLGGKAAFWGIIGDDDFGRNIRGAMDAEGVDTGNMQVVPGAQSQFAFCVAHADTGKRSIFWKASTTGKLDPATLDRAALMDCRAIMVDGHHVDAAIQAVTWAREEGIPTVLDMERCDPRNGELLRLVTYAILPEGFLHAHTGNRDFDAAVVAARAFTDGTLIITRGDRGSVAFAGNEVIQQPAFQIERVVDTTGAGDVFHGSFAYGLALGYGLRENLRFASAVAALKCRALGGRAGIPNFAEARALMG